MNTNLQRFSGEWKTKRLGDIASIRNQKVLPASVNPNTPCVELDHIGSGDGQLLKRATAEYSTASKYCFFAGDVLFGRLRSYLRKFWLADRDGICTTEIWPLMVDTKQIDNAFLHAIVQSDQFFALANISYGTHMPRTDWTVMRNFTVMLPPIQEQRAIAEVLSDVDRLLTALEVLIAKKRAIKQAVMQQLLTGKTRLPGFSGAWETKRVSEFGDVITGATPSTKINAFWNGPYPWITPTDISSERDMTVSERMITQEGLNAIRTLPPNTVLITCIASIGKNAILKTTGSCNQQINAVVPNAAHNAEFLYYLFEYNSNYLLANAGVTATPIISKSIFSEFVFQVPSFEEQRSIASVLSDMDSEIAALAQRRDKTRAIKQGMMQQLLTGHVRLVK